MCRAGTISMEVTCAVAETNLVVSVVNGGDEPAQNVVTEVSFLGDLHHAPSRETLDPGEALEVSFALEDRDLTGTYPAVVTVFFEDLNAYPFSSVTVHPAAFGKAHVPRIFGTLEGGRLRRKRNLTLSVRSQSTHEIAVDCRVVVAREMLAEQPEQAILLPADGVRKLEIRLENFSVLPGSTYPVYVLLEYDEAGEHFCAIASSSVDIQRALPLMSAGFWIVLLAAACGTALALWRLRAK